jgi:hypothetical protein
MPSLSRRGVRLDINPQFAPALEQLGILLDDYHYSPHARGRILAFTAIHGTPTGCPELDREDEQDAEMVFVSELPEVPFDSESWGREDVVLDVALLVENRHPWPMPDEPDDADRSIPADAVLVPPELLDLAPISGGAPEDLPGLECEPYVPTAEDLADYAQWSAELDARRDQEDFYRRHPLSEFNAMRAD